MEYLAEQLRDPVCSGSFATLSRCTNQRNQAACGCALSRGADCWHVGPDLHVLLESLITRSDTLVVARVGWLIGWLIGSGQSRYSSFHMRAKCGVGVNCWRCSLPISPANVETLPAQGTLARDDLKADDRGLAPCDVLAHNEECQARGEHAHMRPLSWMQRHIGTVAVAERTETLPVSGGSPSAPSDCSRPKTQRKRRKR